MTRLRNGSVIQYTEIKLQMTVLNAENPKIVAVTYLVGLSGLESSLLPNY